MMTLSHEQMLAQWKMRHYLEPVRSDSEVSRSNGVNVDYMLSLEMRDWYLELLDKGELRYLELTDIASETATINRPETGAVVIKLPEQCRRVVSVKIAGNEREIMPEQDEYRKYLQLSEYTRGGASEPVAVMTKGGELVLYGNDINGKAPEIEHIYAVMLPPDGKYVLDESALKTIPTIEI